MLEVINWIKRNNTMKELIEAILVGLNLQNQNQLEQIDNSLIITLNKLSWNVFLFRVCYKS